MTNKKIYFFFAIISDYYENSYYPEYDCNVPLLDQAVITATSYLGERGPENARLNGKYTHLVNVIYLL